MAALLPHPLPGAVGLSHLSAYDWEAADGVCGGSPHLHLACTEAYVVTGGRGAVQTLTAPTAYRDIPLEPGSVAWFTPGTVHRMVQGGDLRITVLMQNSGLPEAGDAVFTFPPEVLADPERYAAAAALPARYGPGDGGGRPAPPGSRRRGLPRPCARHWSPETTARIWSSSGPPPGWCATRSPPGASCGGPAPSPPPSARAPNSTRSRR